MGDALFNLHSIPSRMMAPWDGSLSYLKETEGYQSTNIPLGNMYPAVPCHLDFTNMTDERRPLTSFKSGDYVFPIKGLHTSYSWGINIYKILDIDPGNKYGYLQKIATWSGQSFHLSSKKKRIEIEGQAYMIQDWAGLDSLKEPFLSEARETIKISTMSDKERREYQRKQIKEHMDESVKLVDKLVEEMKARVDALNKTT